MSLSSAAPHNDLMLPIAILKFSCFKLVPKPQQRSLEGSRHTTMIQGEAGMRHDKGNIVDRHVAVRGFDLRK